MLLGGERTRTDALPRGTDARACGLQLESACLEGRSMLCAWRGGATCPAARPTHAGNAPTLREPRARAGRGWAARGARSRQVGSERSRLACVEGHTRDAHTHMGRARGESEENERARPDRGLAPAGARARAACRFMGGPTRAARAWARRQPRVGSVSASGARAFPGTRARGAPATRVQNRARCGRAPDTHDGWNLGRSLQTAAARHAGVVGCARAHEGRARAPPNERVERRHNDDDDKEGVMLVAGRLGAAPMDLAFSPHATPATHAHAQEGRQRRTTPVRQWWCCLRAREQGEQEGGAERHRCGAADSALLGWCARGGAWWRTRRAARRAQARAGRGAAEPPAHARARVRESRPAQAGHSGLAAYATTKHAGIAASRQDEERSSSSSSAGQASAPAA